MAGSLTLPCVDHRPDYPVPFALVLAGSFGIDRLRGADGFRTLNLPFHLDWFAAGPGGAGHGEGEDADDGRQGEETGERADQSSNAGTGHGNLLAEMDHPLAQMAT